MRAGSVKMGKRFWEKVSLGNDNPDFLNLFFDEYFLLNKR